MALIANTVDTTYEYKVRVSKSSRVSEPVSTYVKITQRDDYTDCVSLSYQTDFTPLTYDYNNANVFYFDDTIQLQFTISMTPDLSAC